MPSRSNVAKDSGFTIRMPSQLVVEIEKLAVRRNMKRSELIRQLIEREIVDNQRDIWVRRAWIRQKVVRRCFVCTAFVRTGYTCATCRTSRWDQIVVDGNVVPIPSMLPMPLSARPDLRDNAWQTAEQVVLDAFAPVVGIIYELITKNDCLEPTNLDEIADLLDLATSIKK